MKKIAIITAMKEEAEHIIKKYNLKETNKLKHIFIYENEDIVLVLAWIWKIQASIATTYLFLNYKFDKLINIWISWSLLSSYANIWDVFLVTKISQHDVYLPFDWEHLNYIKKEICLEEIDISLDGNSFNVNFNSYCLTWDQFIDNIDKVNELKNLYDADVIEMEAFAVVSTAKEFDRLQDVIVIKAISDWADNEAKDAHMWNLDFAMNNSLIVLDKVLEKYL